MALYYTLSLYREVYALILLVYDLTKEFPREYTYTLGQDLKHDSMQLVRHIYRANQAQNKAEPLAVFADDFEIVKLEFRLSHDLRLISAQKYAQVIERMDSIGKQLSGWRRKASEK